MKYINLNDVKIDGERENFMTSIITFLIVFSLLVTIHEFGHFYFARKAGILVREFAIGMGPKLFSREGKDGVLYTLRMLPLGGYVRLAGLGEEADSVQPGMQVGLVFNEQGEVIRINTSKKPLENELPVQLDSADLSDKMILTALPIGQDELVTYSVQRQARVIESDGASIQVAPLDVTYGAAGPWAKFMTNVAGPINNFILSVIIFTVVAFMTPMGIPSHANQLGNILPDGAAAVAGLQAGDIVETIGNQQVTSWENMVEKIVASPNQTVTFKIKRGSETLELPVEIKAVEDGRGGQRGQIGVLPSYSTNFIDRIMYGFTETWATIVGVVSAILSIFKTGFNLNNFGGPVAVAQATGQVAKSGFISILYFMGLLSANLGAFNLLPIPALDGGKLVLNVIEALRGKPLSQEKEGIITIVGAALLFAFMLAVTWNDIARLFIK